MRVEADFARGCIASKRKSPRKNERVII